MLTVKVPLKEAQKAKKALLSSNNLDFTHAPLKQGEFIYYPVTERFNSKFSFIDKMLEKRVKKQSMKESLAQALSPEELSVLNKSMDVIGSIAIIEIPDELRHKAELIAKSALQASKNIKTVLLKGKHEGVFRTQELKYLAGENTKEATCKENGVLLKVDVEKVYFSPRLSQERMRIASQVKPGEDVLVMFSGCAPYNCVIAKNSSAKTIDGIEINPFGHEYGLENLKLNKVKNAQLYCGDAHEVAKKLNKKYDRIIMPLPKTADEFLPDALMFAKKGAIIHFYDFELEAEVEKGVEKIKTACKTTGKKFKLLATVKTGQPGPRAYRYCYDFEVE